MSTPLSTLLFSYYTTTTTKTSMSTPEVTINVSDMRAGVTFSVTVGTCTSTSSPLHDDDPDILYGDETTMKNLIPFLTQRGRLLGLLCYVKCVLYRFIIIKMGLSFLVFCAYPSSLYIAHM